MSDQLFGTWLERTRELQVNSFGTDPHALEGADLAEYVTWNVTALVAEIGEVLQEFPTWKPWVEARGSVVNRDAFVQELVDVLHFAGNLLCAVGCTDAELNARYIAKQKVNADRQATGYDGVTGKDWTGRALDEPCDPLPAPRDSRGL